MHLQAQLACLKEQAAQSMINTSSATANPNEKYYGKAASLPQDLQSWLQPDNSNMVPQFNPSLGNGNTTYAENGFLDPYSMGNYGNSSTSTSFDSFEEASHSISSLDMQTDNRRWTYQDSDDLRSVAFGYIQHS